MKFPVAALFVFFLLTESEAVSPNQVLVAVNAGGPAHRYFLMINFLGFYFFFFRDSYGISYTADLGSDGGGIASDYGRRFDIQRVDPVDQILYQTERYWTENKEFGYQLPLSQDGEYVLVLKFCEVYFKEANQKVVKNIIFINNSQYFVCRSSTQF
jgi:hypothetical protein